MVVGFVGLAALSGPSALAAPPTANWNSPPSWERERINSVQDSPSRPSRDRDYNNNISPFAPGTHNLAIDLGQVFLMGDLSKSYANAIGGELHYSYGVSDLFAFDSSFGYSAHSDGDFSMTALKAGLRTNLSWFDKVIPYLTFGLGFYKPTYRISATNSVSPLLFGIHLGPGVDLQLTRNIFFGASLVFHNMFSDSKTRPSGMAMDLGGAYTTFLLHAGYTF